MVVFDDAFGEREPQSPAAFFGGESGSEDVAEVFFADAFTGVGHGDDGLPCCLREGDVDCSAGIAHRIYGVFAEIFYHPLEERTVEADDDRVFGQMGLQVDVSRGAPVHVVGHVREGFIEVGGDGFGPGTDFGESLGDELQPTDVFLHFGDEVVVGIGLFKHFGPGHETGDGGSELVCGFFGQSHPYFVLFGPFGGEQGEDGHDDEDEHDAQLDIGIEGQSLEDERVVVADVDVFGSIRAVERDADGSSLVTQLLSYAGELCHGVGRSRGRESDVAEGLHPSFGIQNDDGDGVVFVDDFEDEPQVGVFVGLVEGPHRLGPGFHFVSFFGFEVARKGVRYHQRAYGDEHRSHHQGDFHLSDSVCPIHILQTQKLRQYCIRLFRGKE